MTTVQDERPVDSGEVHRQSGTVMAVRPAVGSPGTALPRDPVPLRTHSLSPLCPKVAGGKEVRYCRLTRSP